MLEQQLIHSSIDEPYWWVKLISKGSSLLGSPLNSDIIHTNFTVCHCLPIFPWNCCWTGELLQWESTASLCTKECYHRSFLPAADNKWYLYSILPLFLLCWHPCLVEYCCFAVIFHAKTKMPHQLSAGSDAGREREGETDRSVAERTQSRFLPKKPTLVNRQN